MRPQAVIVIGRDARTLEPREDALGVVRVAHRGIRSRLFESSRCAVGTRQLGRPRRAFFGRHDSSGKHRSFYGCHYTASVDVQMKSVLC